MTSDSGLYLPSYVVTEAGTVEGVGVLVRDGLIEAVEPRDQFRDTAQNVEVHNWEGLALLPGTINSHCHSFQSLLRGFTVDEPFHRWRDGSLYRYAPLLDPEAIYTGALLAFGEMMRYGVTTVADFFYVHGGGIACDEAVIEAARTVGIRLVLARTMYDWTGAPLAFQETVEDAVHRTRVLAERYNGSGSVTVCPAPHSLHAASPLMVRAGHALAQELGTRFHIHVAEEQFEVDEMMRDHGCRPVRVLERLGVVDDSMVAIHLVWLDDDEVRLLGARGAHLAYCPSSNMFLADGVTRIPDLRDAGVTIGLGTDGACSNNRSSVFEEMRMVALLQKVTNLDATIVTAREAFHMGTRAGGAVLGLEVGTIEQGFYADFMGIDLQDLSLQPAPRPLSCLLANVVYAMQPNAIDRVVVGGREVVTGGRIQTVNVGDITRAVRDLVDSWPEPRT